MEWHLNKATPGVDNVLRGVAGSAETTKERLSSKAIVRLSRANRKSQGLPVSGGGHRE
jgi:hypothetical protein